MNDNLEDRLRAKLENGEISQEEYIQLKKKFEKLGILKQGRENIKRSNKLVIRGEKNLNNIDIDAPLIVSGKLSVDGKVKCNNFNIMGYTNINGKLIVNGKTNIGGTVIVDGDAEFLGRTAVTGSLRVTNRISMRDRTSISGKAEGGEMLISDKLKINGELRVGDIRSADDIIIFGKILSGNILCNNFTFISKINKIGISKINGNIRAQNVSIGILELDELTNFKNIKGIDIKIDNLSDIGIAVNKIVSDFVPGIVDEIIDKTETVVDIFTSLSSIFGDKEKLVIYGNVIAENIKISYTDIKGDIMGDTISIGPGVTVTGKVKYRKTISINNSDVEVEKIE